MPRSATGRVRETIRETNNTENMTPTNMTSHSNRKTSTKKRLPLGELKKSELESIYNSREALLKLNKCEQSKYESHVKTVEKRKVTRDKQEVYTSVKVKHQTISTTNQNTTLFNITDDLEKDESFIKKNDFVKGFLKNVTERQLFRNSPCILDMTGIKECAWIRDSTDKENDDKIKIVETVPSSETSNVSNEASCKKYNHADDQKKKHSRYMNTANYHKSNGKIEFTKHNFDNYLEKRKMKRTKTLLDKLSKDDDSTLTDFLEQTSLINGHEYYNKSEEPQVVVDEPPTVSEESRGTNQSNDNTNLTLQNIPLNKTYVVKYDDGTDSSSYYAKLPFIDSLCSESSEIEVTINVSTLMQKLDIQDYEIDTASNYLEISINDLPEMTTSNGFSTDADLNRTHQGANSIQTAPVMQNANNVFNFGQPVMKKTPSYAYQDEIIYPVVKNIKYSLKRPSSRELSLRTTRLPLPRSKLANKSGSSEEDWQSSNLKSDPQALIYSLEYLEDIITHLLAREREMSTLPNDPLKYDVTEINRSIIVNWLIKLNTHLQDGLELLEAGVRLFDLCIARARTPLKDLQLLSTACYWLAQKLVGIGPPRTAGTMSRRCGGAFGAAELLCGERRALQLLQWPSPPVLTETFAQYALRVSKPERPQVALSIARYLLMAALLHTRLASLPPSRLAPAAVAAALRVCAHDDWPAFWTCRLCHSVEDIICLEKELLDVAMVIRDPDCLCREPYYLFCQTRHHAAALRVTAALDRSASNDSFFSAK